MGNSIIIFFLLFNSYYSQVTVDVDGSTILGKNLEINKEEANKDAFINAIKTYIIDSSKDADFLKTNEVKLKNNIFKNIDNYIESYKINSEEKVDNAFRVNISVTLDTVKLKNDLNKYGLPLNKGKVSTVISFVAEKKTSSSDLYATSYVTKNSFTDFENYFSNFLSDKGFSLINPYEAADNKTFPNSNTFLLLKTSELINYGKSFNADLITSGYLETTCKTYAATDEYTCTTIVSLQAISTKDGKIVFAKKVKESFRDKDESQAYKSSRVAAIKAATDAMASQVNFNWKEKTSVSYKIKINNLKTYEAFKNIKAALESADIEAISKVIEREEAKDYLVLNVDTSLDNMQKSKNLILNKLKENFNFKITESKNEILTIDLI